MALSPRVPFDPLNISRAPTEHGVYLLWDGEELIYIGRPTGRTATIQTLLSEHYSGGLGACTQKATHYCFEISSYPATRQQELLEEFRAAHKRPPRCQD